MVGCANACVLGSIHPLESMHRLPTIDWFRSLPATTMGRGPGEMKGPMNRVGKIWPTLRGPVAQGTVFEQPSVGAVAEVAAGFVPYIGS